ncbi:hypothetical protein NHF46_24315 [Arthrobacter alpinus]|nr:hypothetical protein [Arthrobacter alpinus]
MLRVRPIILTSNFTQTVAQLRELGLSRLENDGDWAEFDSGNGKVGVFIEAPETEAIKLGFEVRDAAIFVRRTLEDGTHAEEAHTFTGPGARVTAPTVSVLSWPPPRICACPSPMLFPPLRQP